jgi:hypothetical protein
MKNFIKQILIIFFVILINPISAFAYNNSNWDYADYGNSIWGSTSSYNNSYWSTPSYNYSNWDYADYNYSNWDYADYNYSNWDYADYNYSNWDYADYNYSNWDYADYNYPQYDDCDNCYTGSYDYFQNYSYQDYYNPNCYECETYYSYPKTVYKPVIIKEKEIIKDRPIYTSDLNAYCVVSRTHIEKGQSVTFSSNVSGGKSPYTYRWSGDTTGSSSSRTTTFNRAGTYIVYLEVTDSKGKRATDTCATVVVKEHRDDYYVNDTTVYSTPIYNDPVPKGNLASVNSVYLSQLPYTGPEDIAKVIGYISLLLLISSIIGYSLLNNRKRKEVSNRIKAFKEANKLNKTV